MDELGYKESCCPFDSSAYVGTPDADPCPVSLDVPQAIRGLDRLYEQGREDRAQAYLEDWLAEARSCGDWRAELSFLSELLGQYRRSLSRDKGLDTVRKALELIRAHRMGQTVSGATVMLNAATTLKCFGRAEESIPIFHHVARVYSSNLDPMDYRFAGLYNNMALSYGDLGETQAALDRLELALKVMEKLPHPENDMAVSLCNMAEILDREDPEDERIALWLERAWELLNAPDLERDGYHAFTISKCAPCFDRLGFFLYAKELRERAEKIYAGA